MRIDFRALAALGLPLAICLGSASPMLAESDPEAVEIAERVLENLGGRQAWEKTRYIRWTTVFAARTHHWDRKTGNLRLEGHFFIDNEVGNRWMAMLFNLNTGEGRVWDRDRQEIDPEQVPDLLEKGREAFATDSPWMFAPYQLLAPGNNLRYLGTENLPDGRLADAIEVTFDEGVFRGPLNRWEILVARDTGLVSYWRLFRNVDDQRPKLNLPWDGWTQFGRIKLATNHGMKKDWNIAVYDELPDSVFTDPAPPAID